MVSVDTVVGAALAAGLGALATAVGSHVRNGNRITALEVHMEHTTNTLERIEAKMDDTMRALAIRPSHQQTPREDRRDADKQPRR